MPEGTHLPIVDAGCLILELVGEADGVFGATCINCADDCARIFPQGIPITVVDGKLAGTPDAQAKEQLPADAPSDEPDVVSTKAEGGLQSEAGVLDEQARQAQPLRDGENLLPKAPGSSSAEKPARNSPVKAGSARTSS